MAESGSGDSPATTADGPVVPCPRCGKPAIYAPSNPSRPFCSERCRLIDLGAWASEDYRIPESAPRDGGIAAERDED